MKLGLYYNVLNSFFPEMEWDEYYGVLLCVKYPLPTSLLLLPFLPLFTSKNKEFLKLLNSMCCYMIYLPNALIITACFTAYNIILCPISYVCTISRMISRIFTLKKCDRVTYYLTNLAVFMLAAPFLFMIAIPINSGVLLINIFYSDKTYNDKDNFKKY